MGYSLVDITKRSRENPDTFSIPTVGSRESLSPGAYAKLVFEEDGCGERMWVRVERVILERESGAVSYVGTLKNRPVVISLEEGVEVSFGPEHVASLSWSGD